MAVGVVFPHLVCEDVGHFTTDASTHHKFPILAEAFDRLDLLALVWRVRGVYRREALEMSPRMRLLHLTGVRSGWEMWGSKLPVWMWQMARIVARHRREWSAALVIDSGPASHWFFESCRRAGIPTAVYLRGNAAASVAHLDRYRSGVRRLWRRGLGYWYPWSTCRMARFSPIVTDSDALAAQLRQRGADVRLIVASSLRATDVVTQPPQQGSQPDPLRICYVGRVIRLKGLHVLLEALAMLAAEKIEFAMDIIGPGDEPYLNELRRRAARKDLSGRVRLLGPVPFGQELFRHLDREEVFVQPSFTEGTPKTVVEAMARGLVVVASRVGGLPRLVSEGQTGFLVDPGDAHSLFDRLRMLALDPALRCHMAENSLSAACRLVMEKQVPILVTALTDAAQAREHTAASVYARVHREGIDRR